jgi:lipopolysaccharide export system permease protein
VRISLTLSSYLGRQFLLAFLGILAVLLIVIFLADVIELLRRVAAKEEVPFSIVLKMALLKLPFMVQQAFPFVALFATLLVFWRLSRSHELTVIRASGISAWQFLLPPLVLAVLLGVLQTTVFHPFASAALARYERLETVMIDRNLSTLALSRSGLWLRQVSEEGQAVIHAVNALQQERNVELRGVTVFRYKGADAFVGRVDAAFATLEPGVWLMRDAWIFVPEQPAEFKREHTLPTDLTLERIQDSFAKPETISFWQLPGFIRTLEAAGFSAASHRLHLQTMLAAPLLMVAMVFIAAPLSLRHSRGGGAAYIIAGGVLTGFALHFMSDLVFAFALSDRIPVVLAAWTPATVATLLGVAFLLHLEDG